MFNQQKNLGIPQLAGAHFDHFGGEMNIDIYQLCWFSVQGDPSTHMGHMGIEKESFAVQRRQSVKELTSIQKRLVFQWTPTQLLGGLMVDNYEAMTIIPPQAVGSGDLAGDCFHLLPIFGGCVSWKCCMDPSMPSHHPRPTPRYESVEDLGNLSSCRHGMVASIYKSVGDFNALQIPNWGITRPGKHTKNY